MILSFKQRFEHKILGGTKIHTIREDRQDRWKAGNKIHFSTGIRTPGYNCFKVAKCMGVQEFEIVWIHDLPFIYIGDKMPMGLSDAEIVILSRNDGFDSTEDFFSWFNKDFKGKIIHWTDFRYDA